MHHSFWYVSVLLKRSSNRLTAGLPSSAQWCLFYATTTTCSDGQLPSDGYGYIHFEKWKCPYFSSDLTIIFLFNGGFTTMESFFSNPNIWKRSIAFYYQRAKTHFLKRLKSKQGKYLDIYFKGTRKCETSQ